MMRWFLVSIILLTGCGIEYSPWQSNPPSRDLTAQHLAWLKNLESESSKVRFAVIGDPQMVPGSLVHTVDILNRDDSIDFITIVGDITDRGLRREFEWIDRILRQSNKPILTVVGNHDGLNNGNDLYKKMFGPLNYSFTFRGVKFIMWNNNYYEWGDPDFSWLRGQVKDSSKAIVLAHQPPGSGTLTSAHERKWKKIRENEELVASVHGHMHHFNFKVDDSVAIYTVDRVSDIHYGVVEIEQDKLSFYNCTPLCSQVSTDE